jgi:hypothetical protein
MNQAPSEDLSFTCNSEIPPTIAEADDYEVQFLKAEKHVMWNRTKLFLWFRVVSAGESFGKELFMPCNIPQNGRFGTSSKFLCMWVLAAGQKPTRRDRMSTVVFRNKVFRAKVRTVKQTSKQVERNKDQQYSVIDTLLEVLVGGGQQL